MASFGLAPHLPLVYDELDGPYKNIKKYTNLVNQNFKMLLLTSPGERMMIPDYGVGMRRYIFEPNIQQTVERVRARIQAQINRYMPFIELRQIVFTTSLEDPNLDENFLRLEVFYYVKPLENLDRVQLTADLDRKVFI